VAGEGDATVTREIYAYRCRKCGHLHYPYRMVCKRCGDNAHNEFDPEPLPTDGTLLTFTELYSLPAVYEVPTLGLGIVELSNGIRITGQLRIEKPRIGMKVKGEVGVVRSETYEDYYGMIFREA
jgi:uncharacterized OB-fold protein